MIYTLNDSSLTSKMEIESDIENNVLLFTIEHKKSRKGISCEIDKKDVRDLIELLTNLESKMQYE